ncbi:MAG: XdhC family protein, partial [Desulfobacterales bacterium]
MSSESTAGGIYAPLAGMLEAGEKAVLARTLSLRGSGPRRPGAALLLTAAGEVRGTVGGGALEKSVLEEAGRVLREGKTRVVRREADPAGEEGCGGAAEVFLEPLDPKDEELLRLLRAREDLVRRGQAGLLATSIVEGIARPPRFLIGPGGSLPAGDEPPAGLREALAARLPLGAPRLETFVAKAGDAWLLFLEPVAPPPLLILLGAGHIAAALAPLARRLGFRVWVAAARPGVADPGRFPDAERVRAGPAELLAELSPGERPYVVIAGPTHEADRDSLRAALQTDAAFIGMVGSRRKREAVFQALRGGGIAAAPLERVRCPVGLPIGAETPEEIAVSIAAELLRERSRRRA